MIADKFMGWLAISNPGDKASYYEGVLFLDRELRYRDEDGKWRKHPEAIEASKIADAVYEASLKNLVYLTQERSLNGYNYIMTRATK